jgi:hypothetical protein
LAFAGTNLTIASLPGYIVSRAMHEGMGADVPPAKLQFYLVVFITCSSAFVLLALVFRARTQPGLRPTIGRLLGALVYLWAGPALFYQILLLAVYFGVLWLGLAMDLHELWDLPAWFAPTAVWLLILAEAFIPIYYGRVGE